MRIFLSRAMFTGIIEELGIVQNLTAAKNLATLYVKASGKVTQGLKLGHSVAVNGVCLTVVGIKSNIMAFEIMRESLDKTTLGDLKPKDGVNLERALKANSPLGGHFVTGHIDGMGIIRKKINLPNYLEYEIQISKKLRHYVAPKGSVALDDVSLTIGRVYKNSFAVYLIPYTYKVTNLGIKKIGHKVNIETDILAKYILEGRSLSR